MGHLVNLFHRFRYISELKLDRLIVRENPFAPSCKSIEFPKLNKLIIYDNPPDDRIDLKYFDFSTSSSLRFVSCPQNSLPEPTRMPKQIEAFFLIECRDYQYHWIRSYPLLRLLKLQYSYFDRLLENHGQLIFDIIHCVYPSHPSMETIQLMCHGTSIRKLQHFEKFFHSKNLPHLSLKYDAKSLSIQRSNQFFH